MWFYVGVGGVIGSLIRYIITLITNQFWYYNFPIATFFVNIMGSFLLGFLTKYYLGTKFGNSKWYIGLTTGIIGSFTTFSAFTTDAIILGVDSFQTTLLYSFVTLMFGLCATYLGMMSGEKCRDIIRKERQV